MKKILLAVISIFIVQISFAQTTVFSDDFQGATSGLPATTNGGTFTTGSSPSMTYTFAANGTNPSTSIVTVSTTKVLQINNGASSPVKSANWVTGPLSSFSSPFNTTLSSNPGLVTWSFNVNTNNNSSGSFGTSGTYAPAVVLAATSATLLTAGNGYAVVSTTSSRYDLVRYTGGLSGTVTTIITGTAGSGNSNYRSIRVTYEPSTNSWSLYIREDGATMPADPSTYYAAAFTQQGSTTVNNTYTGSSMTSFGLLWNHNNSSNKFANFDNFKCTVLPTSPVATAASSISSSGFTANWNAVSGATGYKLDVATSSTISTQTTLAEGFAAGTTQPTGWIFTNIGGTYVSAGNFGLASPSLQLDATGDRVQTVLLNGFARQLSFWIKGQSLSGSPSLLVEGFDGSSWTTIDNITTLTNVASQVTYNGNTSVQLDPKYFQFRFTFTKATGNLAFDDVNIIYEATPNAVSGYSNLSVASTSQVVTGLIASTNYYYQVRAIFPNNPSANSNTITATTTSAGSPDMTLANNTQIGIGTITRNTTDNILSRFKITNNGTATGAVNTINFTTAGSYAATDVSNFNLYYSATNSFPGGAPLATVSTSLGTGAHVFSSLSQDIAVSNDGFFWITTDVPSGATVNVDINIAAIANADITFSSGSKTGSVSAGGLQTIIDAPTVTTDAATAITTTSVTLNGTVNPNAGETLVSFQYGPTVAYGTEVDAVESPLAAGTGNLPVSKGLTSLPTNTLYHYRVLALNDADLTNGNDATFTTLSNAPGMDNATARTPTGTGFTANWTAPTNDGGATYTYTIEVSTDNSSPANFTTNIVGAATQTGIASVTLNAAITGLSSGTTYYYRVKAVNAGGSSDYSAISTSVTTASANIALADNAQVAVANVLVGTNNHILSRFSLTNSGSLDAALNTVNFTTTGTYVAADIANLRFWYNTSNDFSTATQLAALTSSLGSGSKSFTGLTQNIAQGGSPVYCWITTSIAGAATTTNTIAISAIANADITFSGGSKSGSVTAAGAQTFVDGVDGVISTSPSNEYGDHTNGGNQQQSGTPITYMRWTDDKLYVGVSAANLAEGFVLYLDKNPQTPVNGGTNANGTNVGFNYDGTNFAELPFRADLVLYVKSGYREFRTADGSNGWTSATSSFGEYAENGGTSTREFSIPWSVIGGKPSAFNWFGYITSSGGYVYAQTPTENADAFIGTSARYGRYYTVSSTSSTKPFSQNSYVFNSTSDLTGFGAISVYDFTMNTNGKFISRSNSASGAWNIAGNLVVNNGTIYMGASGGSGYGATTVTGNVNVSGGLLDMDYNTNALTVNTDVNLSGSGTLALSNSVGGDLKLKGNWSKTGGTFTPRIRLVEFNGTAAQTLTGSSTFDYFKVDNTNGLTLVSANPTTVNTNITLTAGSKLTIGASDLVFGGVNADLSTGSTNYIVTNSTGQFKRTVGVTATNFPVGNSSYNPLTITNSGTSDIYGIRVVDGAITTTSPNNITKTIDRLWKITEANAGGSILSIAASYNDAEKNNATNFDAATTPRIGLYNGSTWSQVTATGTNTFTASSTLTPSDLTTAQSIALGKDDGFIAFPPEIVLADNGTQVAAANIGKNTTNNIIYKLQLSVTINDATLNSVAFTTTGSYVASSDITNFKLHYSSTNDFSTASPIGSTLTSSLDAGAHTFSGLSQSITATTTGYLWITTDIKSTAIVNNTIAVSAITTSDITVVLGNKTGTTSAGGVQTIKQFTTATDAFRSAITGNWNDVATWESFSGGSWIAATLTPDASASTITILTGHTVTVTASVSIDETTIDAGGQVTVNSGQTLTIADGSGTDLTVNGYLKNTGTVTLTGTATVSGSTATYEHNLNDLTIPAFTWASNSTLKLTGTYTGAGTLKLPSGGYENIIYEGTISSSTDYVSFGDNAITIAGKLTVSGSGSGALLTSAGGTSPSVAEYEQTSGIVFINRNSSGTRSFTVTGNATISGGTLHIRTLANGATSGTLTVGGNLNVGASGTIINSATTGTANLIFNGASPQTWSNAGTFTGTTIGIGVSVTGAGGVTLNNDITLPFASSLTLTSGDFTIASGKTLTFGGTSTCSIAGSRTLTVNGTLTRTSNGTFTTTGTLSIGNGGTYQHNHNGGTIPAASWASGSTCEITGMITNSPTGGTFPAGLGQSFHHFTWNCPSQTSTANLTSLLTTINGNFTVSNTGSSGNGLRLSNSTLTLTVGNNLEISAANAITSRLEFASTSNSGIINIGGNLAITTSGSGSALIANSGSGATINFNKSTGTQTVSTVNGGISTNTISWNIGDGSTTTNTVQLLSNFPMSTSSTLTVLNGSSLDCQTNVISGGTSVTINNGGTLKVGSVNASGAIEDNVTTSTLTLSTGSTVEFNGAAAQFIDTRTFSNLKINNTGGVTMVGDVVVNKNLDLQSDLAIDENFLTLKETTSYGSGLLIGTNLSVLDIQGSSALTATFKVGGQQLLWLNIDQTAGALSLGSPLTIADELSLVKSTSVLHNNIAETITLNGDLTGTGSYIGDGKILFTGNTDTSKVSGATLSNVEFDDTHHFELTGNTAFTGLLTLTNGHVIIGGNTLNLSGTISNASGVLRGSDSSNINITGSGALGTLPFDQTADGTTNIINSFTLNRTTGTASLGNKLIITNVYNPSEGTLNTNGFLHLRSTSTNTARVGLGDINGGYINGDVTVERYAAASGKRAWRLITPGVTTSTSINANWQEGKQNTVQNTNVAADVAGYGIHITGASPVANGFDVTQNNQASLYTFDQTAQDWALVTNTNVNTLDATKGYLLFVRGNRDNITPINTTTGSSNVTLRATGTLIQGSHTFENLASDNGIGDAEVSLVTNPFASPINWASICAAYNTTNVANFKKYYSVWDPTIGTRGGFVTVDSSGDKDNIDSHLTTDIQSGQAFFIETKTGITDPSFIIDEGHKSEINNLSVFRTGTQTEKLHIQLRYTSTGVDRSADGVLVKFGNNYSNAIDENDANQIANWDEDIAILRNGKELSIESRDLIDAADTLYLKIANIKAAQINYRWVVAPQNFNAPGLEAFLVDAFNNTVTPISLTDNTTINFTVSSNTATTAANRFKIVFRNTAALPVTITNIKAQQKNNDVQVQWATVNEQNIDSYEVEKSSNAINFKKLETVLSNSTKPNNTYTVVDASVPTGTFYYRIKIVEKNGNNYYSNIVKITIGKNTNANIVNVYPNPVKGNTLQLQLMNVEQGEYVVRIINTQGQVVQQSTLQHTGGSATTSIVLNKAIAAGNYQVEMMSEKGVRIVQKMIKE